MRRDTSAWIDYSNGILSPQYRQAETLIETPEFRDLVGPDIALQAAVEQCVI